MTPGPGPGQWMRGEHWMQPTPEEREAPRCATCFDRYIVCPNRCAVPVEDASPAGSFKIVCAECRERVEPCPTCSPRSETDGGLIEDLQMAESALLTEALHDGGDRAAVLEAQAARIGKLRERLEAWRTSEAEYGPNSRDKVLIRWLHEAVR